MSIYNDINFSYGTYKNLYNMTLEAKLKKKTIQTDQPTSKISLHMKSPYNFRVALHLKR